MCIYKDNSGEEKEMGSAFVIFIMKLVLLKIQASVIFYKKGTYYILKGCKISMKWSYIVR